MSLDHAKMKRLAFIKYLYEKSVSQSKAPTPLSSSSLLLMHDSIELFLQLASEHLNTGVARPKFMEYWDILNRKLAPEELGQKKAIHRLSKARAALKHGGTHPSELDIESFRTSTISFFDDNTPLVFGINIDEVSLIEFVSPDSARTNLKEALNEIHNGNIPSALSKTALAFGKMIFDYEKRKTEMYGTSPFFFGPSLTFLDSHHINLDFESKRSSVFGSSSADRLAEFIDKVKASIEAMQEAIKILALGLDYRKYTKFKRLTPYVAITMAGPVVSRKSYTRYKPSTEDAMFCIDFVVESSLSLAEFDYSLQLRRY